jgi:hypothetical protein
MGFGRDEARAALGKAETKASDASARLKEALRILTKK